MKNSHKIAALTLEERFVRDSEGHIYSPSGFDNAFFERYCNVFHTLKIIARVELTCSAHPKWPRIDLEHVSFINIPSYIGPLQCLMRSPSIIIRFLRALKSVDVLIVRSPGTFTFLGLLSAYTNSKNKIGVELVGDPSDVFASGVGGIFSPFYRFLFSWSTRAICKRADAVAYVTQRILQARYPARPLVPTYAYSSIELPDDCISNQPRLSNSFFPEGRLPLLFCAASLEVPYKGIHVLLKALSCLRNQNLSVFLRIAGEGRLRPALTQLAAEYGLKEYVNFLGRLSRNAVFDEIRRADLYVQPSLTEGVPRAIIEAFSQGLPVVSTHVGGIPELLSESDMVIPGDAVALSKKLTEVLSSRTRLQEMSTRNLQVAEMYRSSLLNKSRNQFLTSLRSAPKHLHST